MNDSKLHQEGVNRLGNVLVPNDSYGTIIEKKVQGLLSDLYKEGKRELSTTELSAKSAYDAATKPQFSIGQQKTTSQFSYLESQTAQLATRPGFSAKTTISASICSKIRGS